jgi:hypothetical protein
MKDTELAAGMLALLNNVSLDWYDRAHAEQEVRRAAVIVGFIMAAREALDRGGRALITRARRIAGAPKPSEAP